MNEKLKEKAKIYGTKAKELAGKVSKKVWIALGIVVVALIAAVVVFRMTRPYVVLITGSTTDELSAVLSWLDEQNYSNYRLEGDTIYVPESQAINLKARLLQAGYPKTGYGWPTYLDNVGALSTESERASAWLINVMENMAAIIRTFDGVKDAQVMIAPGQDNRYVLDSQNVTQATAHVQVTMAEGRTLSSGDAANIRNLVAHGVQGLQVDSVTIGDNWGNTYSGVSYTSDMDASALKIQLEEENSNKIQAQIMNNLLPLFGEGNVKVSTNVVCDVSYTISDANYVYLPDWAADGSTNGAGIIGSRAYTYEWYTNGDVPVGGPVGTGVNSDIYNYVEQEPAVEDSAGKVSGGGQLDYNNPEEQVHKVTTAGYITDCTVAVSINSTTAGPVDVEAVRSLVARAAGINAVVTQDMTAEEYLAGKIAIYSGPFYELEQPGTSNAGSDSIFNLPVPDWVILAAAAGLLLFLIILLVVILLLRGKKKKKQQKLEAEQQSIEEMLASVGVTPEEPVGADVMTLQSERSMELRQNIRKFAEENPEIAAQLVKSWLRGGDDNG